VEPGTVTEYAIHLRDRSHRFLAGHRLMVQVQSTWFPLIDRNPQTWMPNIFLAAPDEFRKATHRVYVSSRYPTHIVLPVRAAPAPGSIPPSGREPKR
jgi:predicted acyl esterase